MRGREVISVPKSKRTYVKSTRKLIVLKVLCTAQQKNHLLLSQLKKSRQSFFAKLPCCCGEFSAAESIFAEGDDDVCTFIKSLLY